MKRSATLLAFFASAIALYASSIVAYTSTLAMPISSPSAQTGTLIPMDLRCDDLVNPPAIESTAPHLSWTLQSPNRAARQSAYQIVVATSPDLLAQGKADLWDSGRVESDCFYHIAYEGRALTSFTCCYWAVRVWDGEGEPSVWSPTATWTMGVLDETEWQGAQWIVRRPADEWKADWQQHFATVPEPGLNWFDGNHESIWAYYQRQQPAPDAAPLLRREFNVDPDRLQRATLYICGLGHFEAKINGQSVSQDVLNPAWSQFDRTSLYCTYDILPLLQDGANAIGVELGRGQFAPYNRDNWYLFSGPWASEPRLKALIRLETTDGTTSYIITDSSWQVTDGPMIFDDPRMGEIYDARLEPDGWTLPGFDASAWDLACVDANCHFPLHPQLAPAVRRHTPVQPRRTYTLTDGSVVYDLHDNIAGWARVCVSGPAGARVWMEYCELPADTLIVPDLHPWRRMAKTDDSQHALFYDSGTQVRQQNVYILKGRSDNVEVVECHYSYKGFRYIRVTADPGVDVLSVEGIPVHTDLRQVGTFACSNPTINTLQAMCQKTLLNNLVGIPTDCPTREKQGWDADTYMTSAAAMYNFDMATFYPKWVRDLAQSQSADGGLHCVAPATSSGQALTTTWPAAITVVPLNLYRFYGDRRTMDRHFQVMDRFAQSSLTRQVAGKPEIVTDIFGDWMSPKYLYISQTEDLEDACQGVPPEGTTIYGSLFHYRVVSDVARIASLTGRDPTRWQTWAERIRQCFNAEFYKPALNEYRALNETYRQGPNVMSIDFGLVPSSDLSAVSARFMQDLSGIGYRTNLGFLSALSLMRWLPEVDAEAAYRVATQPIFPGWGYMAQKDGITMWEDWAGKASHDHPPFCLISEYFYKHLAGIQIDHDDDGHPTLTIRPQVVGDLTWAQGSYHSAYGPVQSNWRIVGDELQLEVIIPAGLQATVYMPTSASKADADALASVTEGGLPLNQVDGIVSAEVTQGAVRMLVGSGRYLFKTAR